jgi:two-component system CheB/CheR fusion protein
MPADAGIAFAVVQHLAPDHASALPELLARHTLMTVEQVRDNTKIAPNRVYIIPSECHADDQGSHAARGETG